MKSIILVFIFGVTFSCKTMTSAPTFDATNDETIEASIAEMKKGLSSTKLKAFENAFMIKGMGSMDLEAMSNNIFSSAMGDTSSINQMERTSAAARHNVFKSMHGMNVDQIIQSIE